MNSWPIIEQGVRRPPVRKPGSESDLTARARIRDAALSLFAEQGVEATSIREIARRAGVSGGLVQHHFRTKEGLRTACDEFVLSELLRVKEEMLTEGRKENPAFLATAHPDVLTHYRYLARALVDGSPGATTMFEQMVMSTEEWLIENGRGAITDIHAFAALLVAMETGVFAVLPQLSQVLGVDALSRAGHLRISRAKVEFYSTPLITAETARQALLSIDAVLQGFGTRHEQSSTAGETR